MRPVVLAEPERPFWGFAELLLGVGVFMSVLLSLVTIGDRFLHMKPDSGLLSLFAEGGAYVALFFALKIMFARHGQRLWDALGWSKPNPFSPLSLLVIGLSFCFLVVVLEYV